MIMGLGFEAGTHKRAPAYVYPSRKTERLANSICRNAAGKVGATQLKKPMNFSAAIKP